MLKLPRRFSLLLLLLSFLLLASSILVVDASSPRERRIRNHHPTSRRHSGTAAVALASSPSSSSSSRKERIKSTSKSSSGGNTNTGSAIIVGMKNFIASGCAAGCSKLILAPFDTIKTLQQHQRSSVTAGATLSFVEAAKTIMSRPRGVWELYVSKLSGKYDTVIPASQWPCYFSFSFVVEELLKMGIVPLITPNVHAS